MCARQDLLRVAMACVHVLDLQAASHGIEDLPMLPRLIAVLPPSIEVLPPAAASCLHVCLLSTTPFQPA